MIGKISFAERMKRPKTVVKNSYSYELTVPQFETVEKNGVLVKTIVDKVVDIRDRFKGLKSTDFALENLLAVGAVGDLKEVYQTDSLLNQSDNLANSVAQIDAALQSQIKSE